MVSTVRQRKTRPRCLRLYTNCQRQTRPFRPVGAEIPIPDAGAGRLGGKLEPLRDVPEGSLLFFALDDVLDSDDYTDHRSFFVTYRNLIGLARLGGFV
jgi:hypothetical protein